MWHSHGGFAIGTNTPEAVIEPSAMALPHRHEGLSFCFGTFGNTPNDREAIYAWHYQALPAMEELRAAGGYPNHVDTVVPQDFKDWPHVHVYRENADRLVHIKSLYDPSGSLKFPDSLPTVRSAVWETHLYPRNSTRRKNSIFISFNGTSQWSKLGNYWRISISYSK